nr:hypothetical protein [Tanacetum cinerariifolium]
FLEDKPSIAGNRPKWLFDIDVLTKSMNYVSVIADGSLFDSFSKNATNDEPQSSCDAENKDDNGVNKDSGIDDHEKSANKDDNGVNKDDVQKGVIDRMYACLMNQHDETMSPLVLVLMYKKC